MSTHLSKGEWDVILHCAKTQSHTISELADLYKISNKAIYKKLHQEVKTSTIAHPNRKKVKEDADRRMDAIIESAKEAVLKPLTVLGPLLEEATLKNIQTMLDTLNKGEIEMIEKEQVMRGNVVLPNTVHVKKTIRKLTPRDTKDIQDTINKIAVIFGYIKNLPSSSERADESSSLEGKSLLHMIDLDSILGK